MVLVVSRWARTLTSTRTMGMDSSLQSPSKADGHTFDQHSFARRSECTLCAESQLRDVSHLFPGKQAKHCALWQNLRCIAHWWHIFCVCWCIAGRFQDVEVTLGDVFVRMSEIPESCLSSGSGWVGRSYSSRLHRLANHTQITVLPS